MDLNVNVLKKPRGYIKIVQVVLGAVCLGIIVNHFTTSYGSVSILIIKEAVFFLIVTSACLFTSFLLLLSFLHGNTAEEISKTTFYVLYHLASSVLYLSSAITLGTRVAKIPPEARDSTPYKVGVFALICGSLNSLFYAADARLGCIAAI